MYVGVEWCVCVCVWKREKCRERQPQRNRERAISEIQNVKEFRLNEEINKIKISKKNK